jgi:hypothetical protein
MYHLNYNLNGKDISLASITQPRAIETTANSVVFELRPEDNDILLVRLSFITLMEDQGIMLKDVVNHEYWKLVGVNISHSISEE